MIDLQTLTNKWYTIEELTEVFGTQKILSSKKVQYHALKSIGHGDLWHNGRHNHIWIQDLINCVSNGLITIGGQDNQIYTEQLMESRFELSTKASSKKKA